MPSVVAIDDDRVMQALLARFCARYGFVVVGICGDPSLAVRLTIDERPDVLIADHHIGTASGLDVCRMVAGVLGPARPRTVLWSAAPEPAWEDRIDASVDAFVDKTAGLAALARAVVDPAPAAARS